MIQTKIKIDSELVNNFANLTGDKNPIHLDEDFAKTTIFGKPIAHGMLLSSFFSNLIATEYPGPGSIYLSQSLKFKKPCYVGDTVIVSLTPLTIEGKRYTIKTQIHNESGDLLVDGESLVQK